MTFSLILHTVRNVHVAFILPPLVLLIYLIVARSYFIAGSDPVSTRRSLRLAPVLFLGLLAYGVAGQYGFRRSITPAFNLRQAVHATLLGAIGSSDAGLRVHTRRAGEFFDSIVWLSIGSTLLIVWLLSRPVILRRLDPAFPAAQVIIRQHGDHSLAAFAGESDKHHLLLAGGQSTVAYRVVAGVAVTVGDPVGPSQALEVSVDDFLAYCRRHDWTPCFYEIRPQGLRVYRRRRLRTLKVAEEAVIYLDQFTLKGTKLQKVRQAMNKVEREHPKVRVEFFNENPPDEIADQLQIISAYWLSRKGIKELGFTMGRFDPANLRAQILAVAVEERRVLAFVSWRPFAQGGFTLDLMRYAANAPKFIMDYLVARSLLHFQQEGNKIVTLANAPLANVSPEDELTMLDRGVRLLFDNLHGIYEYKSLFQFKKKFNPTWEGRYLAFPSQEALPRVAIALLRVHRMRPLERTILTGE